MRQKLAVVALSVAGFLASAPAAQESIDRDTLETDSPRGPRSFARLPELHAPGRRHRSAPDRVAGVQGGRGLGPRRAHCDRPQGCAPRIMGVRPRVAARSVHARDGRASIHAAHRLSGRMVRVDAGRDRRDADLRRRQDGGRDRRDEGLVEGRDPAHTARAGVVHARGSRAADRPGIHAAARACRTRTGGCSRPTRRRPRGWRARFDAASAPRSRARGRSFARAAANTGPCSSSAAIRATTRCPRSSSLPSTTT